MEIAGEHSGGSIGFGSIGQVVQRAEQESRVERLIREIGELSPEERREFINKVTQEI